MHSVEAMLAVGDATGDAEWHARAARTCELVVGLAASYDGRLPEHFGTDWSPDLELNRDQPDDPFKPFGATVGHGLEWSRLLLHVEAALGAEAPAGLLETSRLLFDRAVADGWHVDGAPGFVYTTDWEGRPVVRTRMHWVAAEAVSAAAALHRRTGEGAYAQRYAEWWAYVVEHLRDTRLGSWHHELDPANRPQATVWPGKPDLYHAVQATLLPRLPLAPGLASALALSDGLRAPA
jgi:mannose/cellobiose epimerase-like protein (N-acyl-D-glucosamine 2-epimerase family)